MSSSVPGSTNSSELQRRLDITKEHNRRAEGVVGVAHAAHLMDK